MSSYQQYSPLSPIEEHISHGSSRSSQDSRESIELKSTRQSGEPAGLLAPHSKDSPLPPDSKVFSSSQQTWKLFLPQCLRWLGTFVFVAFMLATLKIFEYKGNFSHDSKNLFNTVITALGLGLGLNFFEAFKDIAKVLRWQILASRRHSVREVDLILSIESLSKAVELAWVSRTRLLTVLICLSWLLLNLIAQAGVAIIGLTYSVDSGTNWQGIYTPHGIVSATNLTCFADNGKCPTQQVEQIQAHLYGKIVSGYPCRTYKDISEVLNSDANVLVYCKQTPHQQENAFRFSVLNPQDPDRVYPRFTNRIITTFSDQCYQYDVIDGSNRPALDSNGDSAAVSWAYSNGTVNGSITIPTEYSADYSTTYIYPGTQIPQDEIEYSCGPRCMWMWAWRSESTLSADENQPKALIKCPITVSSVTNVTDDTQIVSDGMAKLAASAIGLQGRSANPPQDNGTTTWRQYQFYPWGSAWEIHNHKLDEVGANMAYFALNSLAWMATTNPMFSIEGLVPILGYKLSVQWDRFIALRVCIVGVHFALFAAAVYTSRLVIIKDDIMISTARLLRPLVEHLGPRATLLEGKELSEAIEKYVPSGVVYGPREDRALSGTALDLGEEVIPRRRFSTGRHPDGRYL